MPPRHCKPDLDPVVEARHDQLKRFQEESQLEMMAIRRNLLLETVEKQLAAEGLDGWLCGRWMRWMQMCPLHPHREHGTAATLAAAREWIAIERKTERVLAPERLIAAARGGDLDTVVALVEEQGVDPNHCRDRHERLVVGSARWASNRRNSDGATALWCAAWKGHLRVVRWLLAHRADPNIAANDGKTPAIAASFHGRLKVLQLLAIHGADLEATDNDGATARRYAECYDGQGFDLTAVRFIDAIKGWTPFRIAVACRVPAADFRRMLQSGAIDPAGSGPLPALLDTATSTDELWHDQPKPVPILTELVRAAMRKWSPSTHWLHHEQFREAVCTVLLVAKRLWSTMATQQSSVQEQLSSLGLSDTLGQTFSSTREEPNAHGSFDGAETSAIQNETAFVNSHVLTSAVEDGALPVLPAELWFIVLAELLRRDWCGQIP